MAKFWADHYKNYPRDPLVKEFYLLEKHEKEGYRQRVEVLLYNSKGEVLVGRNPRHNCLCLPGGGIDAQETITAAAARELKEETGKIGCKFEILNEKPFKLDVPNKEYKGSLTYFVKCQLNGGKIPKDLGADKDIMKNLRFMSVPNIRKHFIASDNEWSPLHHFLADQIVDGLKKISSSWENLYNKYPMDNNIKEKYILEKNKKNNYRNRVEVLLYNSDGELLVGKNPRHGLLSVPGGGIDDGETILEAANRELKEETGKIGTKFELLTENPIQSDVKTKNKYDGSLTYFVAAKLHGGRTPKIKGADKDVIKEQKFVSLNEAKDHYEKRDDPWKYLHQQRAKLLEEGLRKTSSNGHIDVYKNDNAYIYVLPNNDIFISSSDIFSKNHSILKEVDNATGVFVEELRYPYKRLSETKYSIGNYELLHGIEDKWHFIKKTSIDNYEDDHLEPYEELLYNMGSSIPYDEVPTLHRHQVEVEIVGEVLDDEDEHVYDLPYHVDYFNDIYFEDFTKELEKEAASDDGTLTVGQLLIKDALPEQFWEKNRILDKRNVKKLFTDIAMKSPEHYKEVGFNLKNLGDEAATFSATQLSFDDFKPPVDVKKYIDKANKAVAKSNKPYLEALSEEFSKVKEQLINDSLKEGLKRGSGLAELIYSGSRGKPAQYTDMVTTPLLVADYKNRPIPIVIGKSYSQGLNSEEYFATSYGTRRGMISTKLAVPKAGYMSKMMGWSLANQVITENDCGTKNGVAFDTKEDHNLGRFLAKKTGNFEANTFVTKDVQNQLLDDGIKKIVLRSPMTCEASAGVCKKCNGVIENGKLPNVGYNVGANAAAVLSEPIQQGMLSEKHSGGSIKKKIGGYPLIKSLVEIPKIFPDEASLSKEHGSVEKIDKKSWGGYNIIVNGKEHYTPEEFKPIVKVGDVVEKGDPLSEGIINPGRFTSLKGIGSGRKQLHDSLRETYREMGNDPKRIHFELVSKAFVNYGKIDDDHMVGDYLPGDVGYLSEIQKNIKFKNVYNLNLNDKIKLGTYLTKPYLHYTVGTEVTPKMANDLKENGINSVEVTEEKMPFNPLMVRIQDTASMDKDWVFRLGSQGLKKSILTGVQRGDKSSTTGYNYLHPYIKGSDFGKDVLTRKY